MFPAAMQVVIFLIGKPKNVSYFEELVLKEGSNALI